jgi:hypothetical protein
MRKAEKWTYKAVVFISIAIIFAVCYHSLEEIHYLKSFYPSKFTVEEAFYAAAVELIKVVVIGIPLFVAIAVSLSLLRKRSRRD